MGRATRLYYELFFFKQNQSELIFCNINYMTFEVLEFLSNWTVSSFSILRDASAWLYAQTVSVQWVLVVRTGFYFDHFNS